MLPASLLGFLWLILWRVIWGFSCDGPPWNMLHHLHCLPAALFDATHTHTHTHTHMRTCMHTHTLTLICASIAWCTHKHASNHCISVITRFKSPMYLIPTIHDSMRVVKELQRFPESNYKLPSCSNWNYIFLLLKELRLSQDVSANK